MQLLIQEKCCYILLRFTASMFHTTSSALPEKSALILNVGYEPVTYILLSIMVKDGSRHLVP